MRIEARKVVAALKVPLGACLAFFLIHVCFITPGKMNLTLKERIADLGKENRELKESSEPQKIDITGNLDIEDKELRLEFAEEKRKVKELERELDLIRVYAGIAELDAEGHKINGDIKDDTPLAKMLAGLLIQPEGGKYFVVRKDEAAEATYRQVVHQYPEFPFGYYYLGLCLRQRNDTGWIAQMQRAKEILEITTTINGHKVHHDEVLRRINAILNEAADQMQPSQNRQLTQPE